MSDHREALEHIMRICATSRTYTRRTQQINDVDMYAVGMTAAQRQARHVEIMQRVGGQPIVDAYLERCRKRTQKNQERQAREENSLDEFDNPLDGQMGG